MAELDVYRIAGAPAPASIYAKYGFRRSATREASITAVDAAWANIANVFVGGMGSSRYSTGAWPVLYCATAAETAQSEKGYWLISSVFSKSSRPDKVRCIEYALRIVGAGKDLLGTEKTNPMIVHPVEYAFCQSVCEAALKETMDYLVVPSARKLGGINVPVLRKPAIVDVLSACEATFYLSAAGLAYNVRGGDTVVLIDDVYGRLVAA